MPTHEIKSGFEKPLGCRQPVTRTGVRGGRGEEESISKAREYLGYLNKASKHRTERRSSERRKEKKERKERAVQLPEAV